MAQEAIEKAEEGDYTGVRNLLNILKTPYKEMGGSGMCYYSYFNQFHCPTAIGVSIVWLYVRLWKL